MLSARKWCWKHCISMFKKQKFCLTLNFRSSCTQTSVQIGLHSYPFLALPVVLPNHRVNLIYLFDSCCCDATSEVQSIPMSHGFSGFQCSHSIVKENDKALQIQGQKNVTPHNNKRQSANLLSHKVTCLACISHE